MKLLRPVVQKGHNLQEPGSCSLTGYEPAFDRNRKSHYTKAGTAGCHRITRTGALAGKARNRMSIVPEISEGALLDLCEKFLVRHICQPADRLTYRIDTGTSARSQYKRRKNDEENRFHTYI